MDLNTSPFISIYNVYKFLYPELGFGSIPFFFLFFVGVLCLDAGNNPLTLAVSIRIATGEYGLAISIHIRYKKRLSFGYPNPQFVFIIIIY